jgi:hypothetical protein
MAHFATGLGFLFSVKMQVKSRFAEKKFPIRFPMAPEITEKIDHYSGRTELNRTQGQAANRPDMLGELAGCRRFKGVVT